MKNRLIQLFAQNRQAPARRFEVVAVDGSDEAELYLYDMICSDDTEAEWWGGVGPGQFVKALRGIKASTIHLRVNSPGGSVFGGRAIEQALREHPARVVAHVDGLAASAASFLIMAADEIVMAKGGMLMIHKAWTFVAGNADDMHAEAALLDKIDGTLVQTYADRTKQDPRDILGWLEAETWLTSAEAVELGFADRIAGDEPSEAEAKAAGWNLSAFLAKVQRAPSQAPATPEASASDDHRARQSQRLKVAALLARPIA